MNVLFEFKLIMGRQSPLSGVNLYLIHLKQTIVSFTEEKTILPVVPLQVKLFNKTYQVNALVYNKAPVDLQLGRNFPDFNKIYRKQRDYKIFLP